MKKNILFVAIILVSSTNIVLSFPTMPQKSTVVDQLMSLNEKDLKKENVSTKITHPAFSIGAIHKRRRQFGGGPN